MYEGFFGLTHPPFALTPDTRRFINLESHRGCFDMLRYAIEANEGFVKVVGDVGTGKTLLCRKFLHELTRGERRKQFLPVFIPNPMLSGTGLLRVLAGKLRVPDAGQMRYVELFEQVQRRLLALASKGRTVVIVIDEAQALPEETLEVLRLITNLETETRKLVQIVLFGQPELDTILEQHRVRQLLQRITFSYELAPMGPKDVSHYVNGRIAASGYDGPPLFRGRVIRQLYRYSRGVPRMLNILCHKALLCAYGRGERRITTADIREAVRNSPARVYPEQRHIGWWWGLVPLVLIAAGLLALNAGVFTL